MASILLLDDNPDMLSALTELLEFQDHYVTTGYNGCDGMAILSSGAEVDLIISDIMMPQMDGLKFIETVRQNAIWAQIPFTFMSGHVGDKERAYKAGADAFINKPFAIDELEALLARLLFV